MKKLNGFRRILAIQMIASTVLFHAGNAWVMPVFALEEEAPLPETPGAIEEYTIPEGESDPPASSGTINGEDPEEDPPALPGTANAEVREEDPPALPVMTNTEVPEEDPAAPTGMANGEEPEPDFTPVPAMPEAQTEAEEFRIEIPVEAEMSCHTDPRLPDSEDLFKSYFNKTMYPTEESADAMMAARGDLLTAAEQRVYKLVKEQIALIADGTRSNTEFRFSAQDVFGKELFTWEELGVEEPFDPYGEWRWDLSQEAQAVMDGPVFAMNLDNVMYALMSDVPYELYWFDKTAGWWRTLGVSARYTEEGVSFAGMSYKLWLCVAAAYSETGSRGGFETDPAKCGATKAAANNAKKIVEDAARLCRNDYEILKYYLDRICDLTDYNYDAYYTRPVYGDPWQVVWIFDGNPATKVVCEGYAKGFKYLCDLTAFYSPETEAHVVTGDSSRSADGSGPHMWNIVRMDDGGYYLVDVTYCDQSRRTYDVFLKGYQSRKYNTKRNLAYAYSLGGAMYYVFDESTRQLFDEELELAETAYNPNWIAAGNTVYITFCDPSWKGDVDYRFPYGTTTNPYTVEMQRGECYGVLPEPAVEREGYTFDGWYTAQNDGKKVEADTVITLKAKGSQTLYARWIPNRYRVCFDVNCAPEEAEYSGQKEKTVTYDETFGKLPSCIRAGYKFTGWYTRQEGGEQITSDMTVRLLSGVTLYAQWYEKNVIEAPEAGTEEGTTLTEGTHLALFCNTPDTGIRYTVNGDAPTADTGALYTGPVEIESGMADPEGNMTFQFVAFRNGKCSPVTTRVYGYRRTGADWGDIREEDRTALSDLDGNGFVDADDVPRGLWMAGVQKTLPYTGALLTQNTLRVYFGKTLLTAGRDYTTAYRNNRNAAGADAGNRAPVVTVRGRGKYAGTCSEAFTIEQIDLLQAQAEGDLTASTLLFAYRKNRVQKGLPVVRCVVGNKTVTLRKGIDYTLSYPGTDKRITEEYSADAFSTAGTYDIILTGKGNYAGEIRIPETITNLRLMSGVSVARIQRQFYTGETIRPAVMLRYGREVLAEDEYDLKYSDNIEIGTATITITGKGSYIGTKTVTFAIAGTPLSRARFTADFADMEGYDKKSRTFVYSGAAYEPAGCANAASETPERGGMTLSYNGTELVNGKDYTVSYLNNTKAGNAVMVFTGRGAYSGTVRRTFRISAYDIKADADQRIVVSLPERIVYAKGGARPVAEVTFRNRDDEGAAVLVQGTDYTVRYTNPNRITITGKGRFRGSITQTFTVEKQDIGALTMRVADVRYGNQAGIYRSAPVLTDLNGKRLAAGTDYFRFGEKNGTIRYTYRFDTTVTQTVTVGRQRMTVSVEREEGDEVEAKDIIPDGTFIRVTVTGKNNYTGTLESCFRIVKK